MRNRLPKQQFKAHAQRVAYKENIMIEGMVTREQRKTSDENGTVMGRYSDVKIMD